MVGACHIQQTIKSRSPGRIKKYDSLCTPATQEVLPMAKRRNYKTSVKKKPVQTTQLVNRKYKDTVFRMLFSDRKNLLSLYNAINGSRYTDPEELEIVTLENAIYMGMKNDLVFIIDTGLFLYEHQ